jgi:hypothetical protein
LLIVDGKDEQVKRAGELSNEYALRAKRVEEVNSWDELRIKLQKYGTIERLVLFVRGTPGSLAIGGVHKCLSTVAKEGKTTA